MAFMIITSCYTHECSTKSFIKMCSYLVSVKAKKREPLHFDHQIIHIIEWNDIDIQKKNLRILIKNEVNRD